MHMDWLVVLGHFKEKYCSLRSKPQWVTAKTHKESEVSGLKATIDHLEKVVSAQTKKLMQNTMSENLDKDKMCYHCGKPRHIKPNCCLLHIPKEQLRMNSNKGGVNQNTDANKKNTLNPDHGG